MFFGTFISSGCSLFYLFIFSFFTFFSLTNGSGWKFTYHFNRFPRFLSSAVVCNVPHPFVCKWNGMTECCTIVLFCADTHTHTRSVTYAFTHTKHTTHTPHIAHKHTHASTIYISFLFLNLTPYCRLNRGKSPTGSWVASGLYSDTSVWADWFGQIKTYLNV